MSTETRVPIKVTGWVVVQDMRVTRVEVDRSDWEFSPLPFISPYGNDPDVVIFHDPDMASSDRFQADVNVTQPIHDLIEASELGQLWELR